MKKREMMTLLLALALPFLPGCTREDYSECPTGLYITFDANNPKHVYEDLVQKVSIRFYDPVSDALVAEYDFDKADLRPGDMAAFIEVPPVGTFRVLAIVNDGIYTATSGAESYSTIATRTNESMMTVKPEALFSGEIEVTVPEYQAEIPEANVSLMKHNNNVHVHLLYDFTEEEGYKPTDGTDLTVWIDADNRQFNYAAYSNLSGEYVTSRPWKRLSNTDIDNGLATDSLPGHPARFSMSTMRLWHGGDMTLHIQETAATTRAVNDPGLLTASINIDEYLKAMSYEEIEPNIPQASPYDLDEELEYYDEYHLIMIVTGYGVKAIIPEPPIIEPPIIEPPIIEPPIIDPEDPETYIVIDFKQWDVVRNPNVEVRK
jgi:hypothetical protein